MVPASLAPPPSSSRRIRGKVEAYTMKRTSTDKKYASHLGIKYVTSLQQRDDLNQQGRAGGFLMPPAAPLGEPPIHRARSLGMIGERGSASGWGGDVRFGLGGDTAEASGEQDDRSQLLGLSKKRRSQSVGYQGELAERDGGASQGQLADGHHSKKARGRSNSLDDKTASSRKSNVLAYNTSLGDFSAQETRRLMTDLILTLNNSFPDYDFEEVSPNDFVKVPLHEVVRNVQSLLVSDSTSAAAPSPEIASQQPPGEPRTQQDRDREESNVDSSQDDASSARSEDPMFVMDDSGTVSTGASARGDTYGFVAGAKNLLLAELWSALDGVVQLGDCDVYQWTSAPEGLLSEDDDGDEGGEDVVTVWSFYYLFVNKNLKRIVFFCCSETLANRLAPRRRGDEADPSASSYMADVADDDDVGPDAGNGGMTPQEYDAEYVQEVDLVSEQDGDEVEDEDGGDEDEDDLITPSQHYKMMLSSGDASSSEVDFDLDPADVAAGGIPVSSV
jgi:hypothetical protein